MNPPPLFPEFLDAYQRPDRGRLRLSYRLALLTGVMAMLLVLGATEIALELSERSRLQDLRDESVTLANTLAAYLMRVAPTGDPALLSQALNGWSRRHLTETAAVVYVRAPGGLVQAAASDTGVSPRPDEVDLGALTRRSTVVRFRTDSVPAWQVALALGGVKPYGVLDVRVATGRLHEWARSERRRAYGFALASAVLLSFGVGLLTARWVGRPLDELGAAMAGAHGGAEGSPAAREIGPPEFRALARRYNRLRVALASRERESEAQSALLALEERARGYDRLALLDETASGFAHEIGTPLNTLSGHLQLLRDDLRSGGDQGGMERVQLLLGHVDRVTRIVRAGLERGAWPPPQREPTDLANAAARVLRFLEPSLATAKVTASLAPTNGSGPVYATTDPGFLEQILLNLLKNAIEALPPGGSIAVAAGSDDRQAWLEIADNGPGIAAETRAQLFHPFVSTKGSAGTGLGLAVSRRLARAMGGDLVPLPVERGTRWRLTLPRDQAE